MCIEWNLWSQQTLAQTTVYVRYMCHGKLLWKYVESDLGLQPCPTCKNVKVCNVPHVKWPINFKRFARTTIHYLYPKFLLRSTPIHWSIISRKLRIPFFLERVFLHSLLFVWLYSYLKLKVNIIYFDSPFFNIIIQ